MAYIFEQPNLPQISKRLIQALETTPTQLPASPQTLTAGLEKYYYSPILGSITPELQDQMRKLLSQYLALQPPQQISPLKALGYGLLSGLPALLVGALGATIPALRTPEMGQIGSALSGITPSFMQGLFTGQQLAQDLYARRLADLWNRIAGVSQLFQPLPLPEVEEPKVKEPKVKEPTKRELEYKYKKELSGQKMFLDLYKYIRGQIEATARTDPYLTQLFLPDKEALITNLTILALDSAPDYVKKQFKIDISREEVEDARNEVEKIMKKLQMPEERKRNIIQSIQSIIERFGRGKTSETPSFPETPSKPSPLFLEE